MLQNKNSLCFFFCLIFFLKTSVPQARKTSDECENEELPEACVQALMSVQKPGVSQRPVLGAVLLALLLDLLHVTIPAS